MALVRICAADNDVRSISSDLDDDLFKLYVWGEGHDLRDSLYVELTEPVKRAFREAVRRWDRDDEARDRAAEIEPNPLLAAAQYAPIPFACEHDAACDMGSFD